MGPVRMNMKKGKGSNMLLGKANISHASRKHYFFGGNRRRDGFHDLAHHRVCSLNEIHFITGNETNENTGFAGYDRERREGDLLRAHHVL